MVRANWTLKLWTTLATVLVAGLLATAGCDESEDDCVGAGCLTPLPDDDIDVLPCDKLCGYLLEACEEPPIKLDNGPGNMDECITLCEDGLDLDERACLMETGCDEAPACLDE